METLGINVGKSSKNAFNGRINLRRELSYTE